MASDYLELAAELTAARRAMDDVRGRAESDDGMIAATVDCNGTVVELELDPRIYRTPNSTELAESIKKTIGKAVKDATRQAFKVMQKTLPPGAKEESTDLVLDPIVRQLELHEEGSRPWAK